MISRKYSSTRTAISSSWDARTDFGLWRGENRLDVRGGRHHGREEQLRLGPKALEQDRFRDLSATRYLPRRCAEAVRDKDIASDRQEFVVFNTLSASHTMHILSPVWPTSLVRPSPSRGTTRNPLRCPHHRA